jgi:hypothetical protein
VRILSSDCLRASAKVSVCSTVSLTPSADAYDHRALPRPAPCRARAWRQPRSNRAAQLRWARPRQATSLGARARGEPTQWPYAGDRYRAAHRALPARLPPYADYILRLQDTEPESLEIMLRLLLVALPLVVTLPAAFDKPELNALQFEVQSPLHFKVRSLPGSRPLRPAATRINTTAPPHSISHAHHPPSAHITMDAPRRTRMRARRSTQRST